MGTGGIGAPEHYSLDAECGRAGQGAGWLFAKQGDRCNVWMMTMAGGDPC